MTVQGLCSWGLGWRCAFSRSAFSRCAVVLTMACLLGVFGGEARTSAQEGQGKYVTEAAARLTKLIDQANGQGYKLHDNVFSIGGGWLKQSTNNWVALFTVELQANRQYRFLGAGDADARDVDLEVQLNGRTVASDTGTDPSAVVNFTPGSTGRYLVRLRLYASDNDLPCVCLGIVMAK